ncbi:hypothetical protein C8J56DRAFT_1042627 [Mycena floridula]|nr:hypothetical protein C8J56DRAFT_1042627 [Mycena floridula]
MLNHGTVFQQPGIICSNCGHHGIVEEYKSPIPSHLLKTNELPLPSEVDLLRNINFQEELDQLDDKIASFQRTLDVLRHQRVEMMASITAAEGILQAHIRRVPPEIIGEIILQALTDPTTGSLMPVSLDVRQGPWRYSRVCRVWRREILSRGSIWANIDIRYEQPEDSPWAHSLVPRILTNLFERSRQHPLRLNLQLKSDTTVTRKIFSGALRQCRRWGVVRFHLTKLLSSRLNDIKFPMPFLEAFELVHSSIYRSHREDTSCIIPAHLTDAPELRRIALHRVREVYLMDFAWSRITHLECDCGTDSASTLWPKYPIYYP